MIAVPANLQNDKATGSDSQEVLIKYGQTLMKNLRDSAQSSLRSSK